MIIKIDEKIFIDYNKTKKTAVVCDYDQSVKELEEIEVRLSEIPEAPTDAELLVWAKENYPAMDYSKEQEYLLKRQQELSNVVSEARVENLKLISEIIK